MPKKTQRNRFTFSYPLNDTIIKSWLDNQNGNTSLALRIVLHNWISQHGTKNVVDDILNRQTDDNVNPNFQTRTGNGETAILNAKQPDPKPDASKQPAANDDNQISAADLNHYLFEK